MKGFCKSHPKFVIDFATVLTILLSFLSALFYFSLRWLMATWSELTVDEVLYHLVAPLQGSSAAMVREYILHALLPSIILTVIIITIFAIIRGKRPYRHVVLATLVATFFTSGYTVYDAWDDMDIGTYISSQFERSDFIDTNYVDPKTVKLTFPEKKRNLIYIFMESTELTFMDESFWRRLG